MAIAVWRADNDTPEIVRFKRRDLIAGVLATVLLYRHATAAGSRDGYDAIVGQDGHATIGAALARALRTVSDPIESCLSS